MPGLCQRVPSHLENLPVQDDVCGIEPMEIMAMSAGNIGMDELPLDPDPLPAAPKSLADRGNLAALVIYATAVIGALYWLASI